MNCWAATDVSVGSFLVIWGFEGRYAVVPKGLLEKKGWVREEVGKGRRWGRGGGGEGVR